MGREGRDGHKCGAALPRWEGDRTRHNCRQMGRAGTLLTACILSAVEESRPSPESEAGAQGRAVVGRERGSTKQVGGEWPREVEKRIFYKIS